jgi:flagellar biosynthesis chaperone FliJ
MITKNNVWKALADKETATLTKLCEKKEALFSEKKRLEARIADIDKYVFEYTSGLQQESNVQYGVQKINDRMNMVTQLMNARNDLEAFKKKCNEALGFLAGKIAGHQVELLKFNKVRDNQHKRYISSENRRDDKELDALALNNFIAEME